MLFFPHLRGNRQEERNMRPKKTILCVDDNEQALAVRKFLLETRGGYRVVAACNGKEAMERFRVGGIDLVLSDLVMPNMDGNELVRRMKEISPEVPMILISGSVKAFDHANRADAFLPKGSSTAGEMLERIRVMIARKRGPRKILRQTCSSSDVAFDALEHAVAS
jgi:two-component system response regulator CpxR